MKRKTIGAWMIVVLLFTQFASSFGFASQVHAEGTAIQENIVTSVTMAVYENGTQVTDSVYKLDSEVQVSLSFRLPELPDNGGQKYHGGDTFTYILPPQLEIDQAYSGNLVYDGVDSGSIGTFKVNTDNKVVLTFSNEIEGLFDVGGTFNVKSKLSSTRVSGTTTQELLFPVSGNDSNTIMIQVHPKGGTGIKKDGIPQPQKYNPSSIAWTLDVNTSLDKINDAVINDAIPAGLELDTSTIEVYQLEVDVQGNASEKAKLGSGQYDASGSSGSLLNLKLGSSIHEAFRVKFSTQITDASITKFTNTAVLTGDRVSQEASKAVDIVRGKPLEKSAGNFDTATETIPWEIRFNYNEQTITSGDAVLLDYFNKSQVLVEDSVVVYTIKLDQDGKGSEQGTLTKNTDYTIQPLTDKADKNGFKLQFMHTINSPYKIVYKTKVADRVYGSETIKNEVTYGDNTKEATQQISQRIVEKKVGDVDYLNKTVKWTINVNKDAKEMNELILTDTFDNAGLKLIGLPVITSSPSIDSADYTITPNGNNYDKNDGFTIEFTKPVSHPFTVTYTTSFDYYKLQNASSFKNTALLNWKDSNGKAQKISGSATFNPRDEVKNNGLKTGDYDAVTKQITWTVGANYNKRVLAPGATLVDTLPASQETTNITAAVYKLEYGANGNPFKGALIDTSKYELTVTDKKLLEVKFSDQVDYAFYVVFSSEFTGGDVNQASVTNTAILNGKDGKPVSETLTGTVTIPRGGEYITKGVNQDKDDQTLLNWSVVINANQSNVKNVKITDTPSTNQVLLPSSFQLFKTTVASNGTVTKTADKLIQDVDYALAFKTGTDGKESFELSFLNPISEAYVLEYQSVVTDVGNVQLTNAISFSGDSVQKIEKPFSTKNDVYIVETSGTGSGVKGSLEVTKTNESGSEKLSGAEFALFRIVGTQQTDKKVETSDQNGKLKFTNLKAGKYVLKETKAPAGYALDSTEHKVTINSSTPVALAVKNDFHGSLKIIKTALNDAGKKLEGAEFELYDAKGAKVNSGVTDANGELTFTKLKGGNYTLKEITAPNGYVLGTQSINVVIDPSQEKVVNVTNAPVPAEVLGSLKVTKVAQENPDKKLEGAEFGLYDSSDKLVKSGKTDVNGVLEFSSLKLGAYVLKEIKAPAGYVLDSTERAVTISSAVQTVLAPISNQKTPTLPTEQPTTPPATPVPTEQPTTPPATPVPTEQPTMPPATPAPTEQPTTPPATPAPTEQPTTPTAPPVYATPTPVTSSVPGTIVTPGPSAAVTPTPAVTPEATAAPTSSATPSATPAVTPQPVVSSTPAAPQATEGTTLVDVPIEGEIPLGGVPSIGTEPEHGTAIVTPNGKWIYTPDPGYIGKDKFTIVVTDEDGNEEEVVIEIEVEDVPLGTVPGSDDNKDNNNNKPGQLPQTGENSPLPLYMTGGAMIVLGAVLARRFKTRTK